VGPQGEGRQDGAKFQKELVEKVPYFAWVPFLFTSALTGQRVTRVLDTLLEVDAERHKRISTSQVNDTLEALVQRTQPPQAAGHHEIRLNYATQVETAPPAIAVFSNHPDAVAEHYVRTCTTASAPSTGSWGTRCGSSCGRRTRRPRTTAASAASSARDRAGRRRRPASPSSRPIERAH
jgi:hypothetical protein